ncbi:MAG: carboxypeptidase-like regulatory domain-containing protein, partial [Terracidiphilus sp.]
MFALLKPHRLIGCRELLVPGKDRSNQKFTTLRRDSFPCVRRLSSMLKVLLPAIAVPMLVLGFATRVEAQTGSINGRVVDPSGAVIPNAHVQIFNAATGVLTRDTTSNGTGDFQLLPLLAATYNIRITAPGMEELDRKGIV